ncbi:WYL domain-containing protein [Streptomyces sp. NPDC127084]|uniref:WYL domain-containing protein n=1 Tax=Streptomyces sp. NPDC127084 TaxID=3347133 RepID=UPI003654ACAE
MPRRPESGGIRRLRPEVTFQDPRHAEWALWQLGTDAEALDPHWLRDSLRERVAAIATCYSDPGSCRPPRDRDGAESGERRPSPA